ncbi:MAG TPA: hypothetical protein PK359_03715 [Burkholderiaceae bacterium]|jgi:hypothetical protein|nr:hypothetical protein [Burkholderiaceae bacterium]
MKELLMFLANFLLFLSISTLLLSVAAYLAFRMRNRSAPKRRAQTYDALANPPSSVLQPWDNGKSS